MKNKRVKKEKLKPSKGNICIKLFKFVYTYASIFYYQK